MATKGTYVKPAPIGSNVITTDDVIAAGYDFVYLKMGGMLKVQEATVDGDLTVKGDTAFAMLPLSITTQPAAVSAAVGAAATFSVVAAEGLAPYTYQWYKADVDDEYPVGGTKIMLADNATAQSATLSIAAVAETDAGSYYVVVRDSADNVLVSAPALLTVTEATGG